MYFVICQGEQTLAQRLCAVYKKLAQLCEVWNVEGTRLMKIPIPCISYLSHSLAKNKGESESVKSPQWKKSC